jgi:uncharacterized membrane protein
MDSFWKHIGQYWLADAFIIYVIGCAIQRIILAWKHGKEI